MSTYQDGYFGIPVCVATEPSTFPFKRAGDPTTETYSRTYEQDEKRFTQGVLGSVDPLRSGFYLLDETSPEKNGAGRLVFKRTYCNVSNVPRYKYGSVNFTRPSLHGVVYGGARYVSFDGGASSTKFTSSKTVFGYFVNPAGYRFFYFDETTTPPYQAGDMVAIWSDFGIIYTGMVLKVQRKTDTIPPYTTVTRPDGSTALDYGRYCILLQNMADDVPYQSARYVTGLGRESSVNIANGAKICSARTKTLRILCGVTPGISTPSDISLSPGITTPYQWAAAMGATWASLGTVSVEDLGGGWIDVSTQELQVADALEVS